MIKILSQNGNISYDVYEYVVDTFIELNSIANHSGMGSKAFVIDESKTYILDGVKNWIEMPTTKNSGGADYDDSELRVLIQSNTEKLDALTDLAPEDLDTLKEISDKLTDIDTKIDNIDTLTEDEVNSIVNSQLQSLTNEEIDSLFGGIPE